MLLFWLGLALTLSVPFYVAAAMVVLYVHLCRNYLEKMVRIFQEKPLFIIPRGQPRADAEDVRFATTNGLMLRGCYLRTPYRRRGVILFGLEFGSNRWSCGPYVEHLVEAGFDVFAYEPRNQGDSDTQPKYDPLQWVTDYEVEDAKAAIRYLRGRPDADPRGIGFFGISKGGGAGLEAGARDPYVRCFATDGAFATYATIVPYMRHWFCIYNNNYGRHRLLPSWYYGLVGLAGLRQIQRERHCHFPHLETAVRLLAPRPWLMIHGEGDTYIKPEMAEAVFERARAPKEFWLVPGAKHNQALHIAGPEYRRKILAFFEEHLAEEKPEGGSQEAEAIPQRVPVTA